MKKSSNQQKAVDLANRIKVNKNIQPSDPFQVSILKLFDNSSENSDRNCKILIEAMAVYENSVAYRRRIGGSSYDAKTVLKSLLNLYTFFKEIDDGKLEANLHIVKLEMGLYSAKDIARMESYYFRNQNRVDDWPF